MIMRKLMKTLSVLLAVAAGSARVALAAAPAPTNAPAPARPILKPSDLFPDTVVAKGKGIEIKRSLLDGEVDRMVVQAEAAGQPIPPEQRSLVEQRILEQLINLKLLEARATEADRATGYALADKQFEDVKTQLGTEANLARQLKAWGATRDEVLSKWREASVAESVLNRELKVTVTDAEVKDAYEKDRTKFEQPEMVRASHILLSTRAAATGVDLSDAEKTNKHKLAEELLKRARAGEDFAKLAKEYSDDPGSREKGGEYIFARGMMAKEFELAAFALSTNQISDIVTTPYGYHIIKLSSKYPSKMADLNDEIAISPARFFVVKKSWTGPIESTWKIETPVSLLRRQLEAQERGKLVPDYLAKLKKDAGVEILDESLKPKDALAVPRLPAGNPPATPAPKPLPK
jgi:peptidyl-prolyl cis-trans isomerase C